MLKKLIAVLLLLPTVALAEGFQAGKDYVVLPVSQEQSAPKKPEVLEFFNYGCPACFKIDGTLETWIKNKGKNIQFERIPVSFNKSWENYAKAYYIAKNLSMTDKITPLLFKMIHDDKKSLDTAALIELFVNQGADREVVTSAFSYSLTVDVMLKNGMAQMAQNQVTVIPTFVVNQRYKTDTQMATNPERLVQILDYLIALDNPKK